MYYNTEFIVLNPAIVYTQVKFAKPIRVYDDPAYIDCEYSVNVSRRGIGSSTLGYVFSDHYAQGSTWGKLAFFLHLVTNDSFYNAANLRVPITRAASIEGVKLLAPLWVEDPEGKIDRRAEYKVKLKKALKPDVDYVAEMVRLRALDEATRLRFPEEWAECQALVKSLIEAKANGVVP